MGQFEISPYLPYYGIIIYTCIMLLGRNLKKNRSFAKFLKKTSCLLVSFCFLATTVCPPQAFAQSVLILPDPGSMVLTTPVYNPAILHGMTLNVDDPFQFDFLVDTGDDELEDDALRKESGKLIKYFLTALTVPEEEMWVNLSPYEKDRIIADGLGGTEMGRDMLVQDYLLKQLSASLMYPENDLGSEFWEKVYERMGDEYGSTDMPVDTFNKIWIVPERAEVYVKGESVYIVDSHLKVMLEEDYLALEQNKNSTRHGLGDVEEKDLRQHSEISTEVIRETLIPAIEKEVNEGKTFAPLRQIYHSLILAAWFKKNLKRSILGQIYVDQKKLQGIDVEDKDGNLKIYDRYLDAFEKGVFDLIKEEYDPSTQTVIPRKYFSGGETFVNMADVVKDSGSDAAMLSFVRKISDRVIRSVSTIVGRAQAPGSQGDERKDIGEQLGDIRRSGKQEVAAERGDFPGYRKPATPNIFFKDIPLPENLAPLDLIPFLQAQKHLKSMSLRGLETLMVSLGILDEGRSIKREDLNEHYASVYEHLAQVGYSPEVVDKIKGNESPDIALDRTVSYQSGSSRIQSIVEAVANSVDALGGSIGQFGMGVKQILAWLENGERLEVVSKKIDGVAYRLIIGRTAGEFNVAIHPISNDDFKGAMGGVDSLQGTVIHVVKNKDIEREGDGITLQRINDMVPRRFSFVKWINMWTRAGQEELHFVNGWENRKVLAGRENLTHENMAMSETDQREKMIVVSLESRDLRIMDTGTGMDFQVLSRMFLPVDGGDKENKALDTEEDIQAEIGKTILVHDSQGDGTSVVFARNGEMVMEVALSGGIQGSILKGQLMVDMGRLIRVSPSRDKIVLQRNQDEEPLKRGFVHLAQEVINGNYNDQDKVRIINTLIGGLEGIAPGNKAVSDIIDGVKRALKKEMKGFVSDLRSKGAIILPRFGGYDNFKVPLDRTVVFLNENLFNWRGSELKQLKENVGAKALPLVLEGRDPQTGLVMRTAILSIPYRQDVWVGYQGFNIKDFVKIVSGKKLPVIRGDGYVVVPEQVSEMIATLSKDSEKAIEILELLKILAEEDTANSYEFEIKQTEAFASFVVDGVSQEAEGRQTKWGREIEFLTWFKEDDVIDEILPQPFGPQNIEGATEYPTLGKTIDKAYFDRIFSQRDVFVKQHDFVQVERANIDFSKEVFVNVFMQDQKKPKIGDYLDSLGDAVRGKEGAKFSLSKADDGDKAMLSLSSKIAVEGLRKYSLAEIEGVSEFVNGNDEYVIRKYDSTDGPLHVLIKKDGRNIEKFWALALPLDVGSCLIDKGRLIFKESEGHRKIYVDLSDPDGGFLVSLDVGPEIMKEWLIKLESSYSQLLGIVPDDVLEGDHSKFKDTFVRLNALIKEKAVHIIEDGVPPGQQIGAIDALVDEVANNILQISQTAKDLWEDFSEENILPLKAHERSKYFTQVIKSLVQAATVDSFEGKEVQGQVFRALSHGYVIKDTSDIEPAKAINQLVEAFREKNLKEFPVLSKIVASLQMTLRNRDAGAAEHLIQKINMIINSEDSGKYLELIYSAFNRTEWIKISSDIRAGDFAGLGRLGRLLIFLTSRSDLVAEDIKSEDEDMNWEYVSGPMALEKVDVWSSAKSGVRTVEEMAEEQSQIRALDNESVDRVRQNIRSKVEGLRESGGYAAELMQNFLDAMVLLRQGNPEAKGKLQVKFYYDKERNEFVEEINDNGPGAPAGKELALLIRKSNKYELNKDQQGLAGQLAGFFGTGKFTMYAGADNVEIISRGEEKVYVFVLKVDREKGTVYLEKIGSRQRRQDEATGVMVRRVKKADSIIPALEQMFAESAWKINAGFAVTDNDTLDLRINNEARLVNVEGRRALYEGHFYAPNLSLSDTPSGDLIDHGTFRFWEHNDPEVPSEIVDKKGLRVEDVALKEKFLELVPQKMRAMMDKMRIAIQIPLALYESRNGFAQEDEYLPFIQRQVALAVYRSLVGKFLSDESFLMDRIISSDFESSMTYNVAFNKGANKLYVGDRHMFDIVESLNGELDDPVSRDVTNKELDALKAWFDGEGTELEKGSIKQFLSLLEVDYLNEEGSIERGSVVLRRIKALKDVAPMMAADLANDTRLSIDAADRISDPHANQRKRQAQRSREISQTSPEHWKVDAVTGQEKELIRIGKEFARIFGIEDVWLAREESPFSGLFFGQGMMLNKSIAGEIASAGGFSKKVEVIVHELGHLLQTAKRSEGRYEMVSTEQHGFNNWTHDDEFSEMMKWATLFIMSKLSPDPDNAMLGLDEAYAGTMSMITAQSYQSPVDGQSIPILDEKGFKFDRPNRALLYEDPVTGQTIDFEIMDVENNGNNYIYFAREHGIILRLLKNMFTSPFRDEKLGNISEAAAAQIIPEVITQGNFAVESRGRIQYQEFFQVRYLEGYDADKIAQEDKEKAVVLIKNLVDRMLEAKMSFFDFWPKNIRIGKMKPNGEEIALVVDFDTLQKFDSSYKASDDLRQSFFPEQWEAAGLREVKQYIYDKAKEYRDGRAAEEAASKNNDLSNGGKDVDAQVGGIDLNSNMLDLQSSGEGFNYEFQQLTPQEMEDLSVDGLVPVIINITPVVNVPLLLGYGKQ